MANGPSRGSIIPAQTLAARVVALATAGGTEVATRRVGSLDLTAQGIPGNRHAGFERAADSRVPWYRRGEPIRNERQVSLVSEEELAAIAAELGMELIDPEWLGANIVVAGVPSFSFLPRGTRLFFQSGAVLVVTDQNAPCRIAGRSVAGETGRDEAAALRFVEASRRLRGVVAAVDRPGSIQAEDAIKLRVPEQWIWHKDGR
jgi:hypothetical protein